MDAGEDEGEAPAAGRPAPLLEVLPQAGLGRYCGCGSELVLDVTVSQMEREFVVVFGGRGERVQQRTVEQFADTIPDSTQNWPQERVQQHTAEQFVNRPRVRISERVVEQTVDIPAHPSGRNSERIVEQIVPVPQDISQERISERTEEQIVPLLQVLPQERISERTVEQIVPVPQVLPQERISERIEGHIVEGKGTSSSAAVPLDTAEWPGERGFSHFFPDEKSAKSGRQLTAKMQSHCHPSTGPAYEIEHVQIGNLRWGRQWDPDRQCYSWWLVDPRDGVRVGPVMWRLP